jgi:hypothetical protein
MLSIAAILLLPITQESEGVSTLSFAPMPHWTVFVERAPNSNELTSLRSVPPNLAERIRQLATKSDPHARLSASFQPQVQVSYFGPKTCTIVYLDSRSSRLAVVSVSRFARVPSGPPQHASEFRREIPQIVDKLLKIADEGKSSLQSFQEQLRGL